jgi:Tol biopolymer transport system component
VDTTSSSTSSTRTGAGSGGCWKQRNPIRLSPTSSLRATAWSPDGRSIAFVQKGDDGNVDVSVVRADGSEQPRLTSDPGDDWGPSWSPDGQMIAFERDLPSGEELHVMNADGSRDRSLTRNGVRFVIRFAWSPTLPKRP